MRLHSEVPGESSRLGPDLKPSTAHQVSAGLVAQRQAGAESVTELQRVAGNQAVAQLLQDDEAGEAQSPVLDIVGKGGGESMDSGTRATMEQALGADFSSVKIHTDGAAAESAKTVQAHAYTVGEDVVFGAGQYQPGSADGQRMLAHELTHVVQQRSGPVDGTPTGNGISVSDPSDPFERAAEANAERVMSGGPPEHSSSGGGEGGSVQREEAMDEEEPVQGAWVQREEAPAEEEEPLPA